MMPAAYISTFFPLYAAVKISGALIKKEYEYSPNCNYFKNLQKVITPYMRAILIDWMMEVCNEFTLKRETFHLAVNYVDRILSLSCNVQKNDLQISNSVPNYLNYYHIFNISQNSLGWV